MAKKPDPALAPFLDALAEILVARLLKDEQEAVAKHAAGEPAAEVVELHPRAKSKDRPRKRARTARR